MHGPMNVKIRNHCTLKGGTLFSILHTPAWLDA